MIYLDAVAIVKLVHTEAETFELQQWLAERAGERRVTSALSEVEVPRAIHRFAPSATSQIAPVLATLYRVQIGERIRRAAAGFPEPALRSLDAIHLATALRLGPELAEFVTYDKRLLAAAEAHGLKTAAPAA